MFQDIGVSKDLNDKFKAHLQNTGPLDCKFYYTFIDIWLENNVYIGMKRRGKEINERWGRGEGVRRRT